MSTVQETRLARSAEGAQAEAPDREERQIRGCAPKPSNVDVADRVAESIIRGAQAVDEPLAPGGDGDQLRALHDALGRTFNERKFRFLNFVSDGNKNGIPAEKPN